MFTGLVECSVPVKSLAPAGAGARLVLEPAPAEFSVRRGDSVAVSGCCLTVAGVPGRGTGLAFDLSAETLARTWLGCARPGTPVNLERALQLGERLGGHLVQGHVDGLARIRAVRDSGDGGKVIAVDVPRELERFLVDKGSITLDGVSLTVVRPRGVRLDVALIPLTLQATSLGSAQAGQLVHVEADVLGKWVERLLAARASRS